MKELLERIELLESYETHGTLGPNSFNLHDLVAIGNSKPRIVVHIGRLSIQLKTTVNMSPRGMSRGVGYTELFWSDKRNEYWLQDGSGKVIGRFKPEEVKVTRPN
jgi:hypothetical protein